MKTIRALALASAFVATQAQACEGVCNIVAPMQPCASQTLSRANLTQEFSANIASGFCVVSGGNFGTNPQGCQWTPWLPWNGCFGGTCGLPFGADTFQIVPEPLLGGQNVLQIKNDLSGNARLGGLLASLDKTGAGWHSKGVYPATSTAPGVSREVYEFYAKMPAGPNGVWAGLWMSAGPCGQPRCTVEIDAPEFYPVNYIQYTEHNWPPGTGGAGLHKTPAVDLTAGYHLYSTETNTAGICFYLDNQQLGGVKWADVLMAQQPLLLLMDNAWNGAAVPGPTYLDIASVTVFYQPQ